MSSARVTRFSSAERLTHWLTAISFLYAGLSGLAIWSRRMWWAAIALGGGETVRAWHPIAGVVFALLLATMFRRWSAQMRLDADDKRWLAVSHKYAVHQEGGVPESGRFNAGQKMLFWLQSSSAILLFASGAVLWFPELMPRTLRLAAILIHPIASVASIGGIIVHIYMSTLVVPGALRAMLRGWVTPAWAASHHAKWFREIK
ncbi:MAG: formate dehydrogenase subunit gamma [Candidatus Solibacter usitatus]|nr:formate dehydrogenase subunit gamma [Candidatus Solibacter usitatus]